MRIWYEVQQAFENYKKKNIASINFNTDKVFFLFQGDFVRVIYIWDNLAITNRQFNIIIDEKTEFFVK